MGRAAVARGPLFLPRPRRRRLGACERRRLSVQKGDAILLANSGRAAKREVRVVAHGAARSQFPRRPKLTAAAVHSERLVLGLWRQPQMPWLIPLTGTHGPHGTRAA